MKFESELNNLKKSLKNPLESNVGEEEKLRTYFCIYFKEKALISIPGDKDIFVLDNDNKEISELLTRYGVLSNLIWQMDPKIEKDFLETENNLRSLSRPLKKEDFLYVKDVTDKDLKLFYEIFKYNAVGFEIQTWGVGFDEMLLFLRYAEKCNDEDLKRILNFKEKFKITPFLSIISGGKEIGDKILTLGEKLPENVAREVFKKYGEIIDTAGNTQKILENTLSEKVVTEFQKEIIGIKDSLLVRAKNLLVTFYDKKENNPDQLLKDLERYKSEILLYGDTYKKLRQSGKEIKLEDFKDTKITILSQEEKEKIASSLWDITIANRPFITTEEDISKRKQDFYKTIDNKDSNFYILKNKEDILAFCSFTPDKNGDLYVESLNVESEIKSSKVGGEFFPLILEKLRFLGKDIYGHVHSGNRGILNYYERLGFKIIEVMKDGLIEYYEIRIPAEKYIKKAA